MKEKLLNNLKYKKNFKIWFYDEDINKYIDLGIKYWRYNYKDKCYHGIIKDNEEFLSTSEETILKAINNKDYYIKVTLPKIEVKNEYVRLH